MLQIIQIKMNETIINNKGFLVFIANNLPVFLTHSVIYSFISLYAGNGELALESWARFSAFGQRVSPAGRRLRV